MSSGLHTPIFVIDGLDVSFYPTIEDAILDLEGVDVADGVYRVFDSHGHRIMLRAEGVSRSGWTIDIGTVVFEGAESTPDGAEELRMALSEYLSAVDIPCNPETDLATLVRLVGERYRC